MAKNPLNTTGDTNGSQGEGNMGHIDRIIIASANPGKLTEFKRLFGPDCGVELVINKDFVAPREDQPAYAGNAELKAVAAAKQFGEYGLGEDSGMEILALNGMPGPLTARFAALPEDLRDALIANPSIELIRQAASLDELRSPSAQETNELLLKLLRVRMKPGEDFSFEARYVAHIVLVDPAGRVVFRTEHSAWGRVTEPRGSNGFGQDPIMTFYRFPDRSVAQLTAVEKDLASHRGKAVRELLDFLRRPY